RAGRRSRQGRLTARHRRAGYTRLVDRHPQGIAVIEDRRPKVRTRLLAIIATLALLAALKWSAPVTLPLAFALFLIALFWPLQLYLERHLGRGAGTLMTLMAFLAAVALFVGALWYAGEEIGAQAP